MQCLRKPSLKLGDKIFKKKKKGIDLGTFMTRLSRAVRLVH